MSLPATIAHSVQQFQKWLKGLQEDAGLADVDEAYSVFRVVIHQLRDRLTVREAIQLSAQLPLIVRGVYFEGWNPDSTPARIRTRQAFIDAITVALLPRTLDPDPLVRTVFAILAHHLDPGEISDVIDQLPDDLKEFWPLAARTYRERTR